MKKLILLSVLWALLFTAQAQDTIFFKDNTKVLAQVLDVKPDVIRYKKADYPDGPAYVKRNSEIKYIVYRNGSKENVDSLYNQKTTPTANTARVSGGDYGDQYQTGIRDARFFYNHRCGAWATGLVTAGFGILGLIPAIAISATPPRESNLGYPSFDRWQNPSYMAGYKHEAKKIKQRKVWTAFGIGAATYAVIVILLENH